MPSDLVRRRSLLVWVSRLLVVALLFAWSCVAPAAVSKPNIVVILADDLGYGDVGCYNANSKIPTPNLDQLAREGMRFTDAHAPDAVCTPTRYGLLTGRYAFRSRLTSGVLVPWDPPLIEPGRLTLGALLQQHGYQTACIGKWHLGWDWPTTDGRRPSSTNGIGNVDFTKPIANGPTTRGFDYYFGVDVPNYPPYCFLEQDRTIGLPSIPAPQKAGGFNRVGPMLPGWSLTNIMPELTQRAARFVEKAAQANKPFFLYLPLTAPHYPIVPAPEFRGRSRAGEYGDFVAQVDSTVGVVMSALARAGQATNTLLIFTSDNGPECVEADPGAYERVQLYGHWSMDGLRGVKRHLWEGGHRVPFLARWPGQVPAARTSAETICHVDLLATCAALLDAKLPANAGEDSYNVLPALLGKELKHPIREATVLHGGNGNFAIRQGNWMFIDARSGDVNGGRTRVDEPAWFKAERGYTTNRFAGELYNLADDLPEGRNLYGEKPEVVERLKAMLEKYKAEGRSTPPLRAAGKQPNVVVILADDQGWGDLSINGNSNLSTPRIDSLARDGALFDRFYVCPVCSPTRAEFLTGRYHPRGGVHDVSRGGERLNLDEKTIADTFKAAGYATGAFGKWHNGTQYPYHPNARGFDEYYGFCSGHWGSYFDPLLEHNGKLVQGQGYIIDDLTDHALAFIETNRSRPFFCYVPFNTPHSPMQVPERFWRKFAEADLKLRARIPGQEDIPFTRAALAMCENIDWNVGRILDRLDELKLAKDTIVIYFSDNGPNGWRWNGGMKGRKGSTDEGGVRSPFMIRWPGHIPAGKRIPQIAGAIDLLPTLANLANIPMANTKPLDGASLTPLLLGAAPDWPDRMIFSHWNGQVSVRTQRYRLDDSNHLFDLETDPGQDRDSAARFPEISARLSSARSEWKSALLPGHAQDQRPFTVGYREFPVTYLPARDGVPRGNIQRSAGAPNCSFFKNWVSTNDSMTWDIEVATAGKYEAVLYYTCRAPDAGASVELVFGKSRLGAKVVEAYDPPLRGAENDRVPRRSESYVKDFKPLRLGTLVLNRARGSLTLRALSIAGRQVADVRMVALTLQK